MTKCGHKCTRCGHKGSEENFLTVDHIIPVVLGGKNIFSNLQILCNNCAEAKSKKENKYGKRNKYDGTLNN